MSYDLAVLLRHPFFSLEIMNYISIDKLCTDRTYPSTYSRICDLIYYCVHFWEVFMKTFFKISSTLPQLTNLVSSNMPSYHPHVMTYLIIWRRSYPHVIMYKLRRLLKTATLLMGYECVNPSLIWKDWSKYLHRKLCSIGTFSSIWSFKIHITCITDRLFLNK